MDKYEYKFITFPTTLGVNQSKKLREMEVEWNKLGQEGWMYCKEGNGCIIFMRRID